MKVTDRGIKKWQPFDSCFKSKEIIENINREKSKEKLPVLSEDQLASNAKCLLEAWQLKAKINMTYYYDGYINSYQGKIQDLNVREKYVYLNNHLKIYFCQILNVGI